MKNSIFNIKKSGRKGNLLAILLTVTASLLYCSSAWAGYGFFDDGTCDLQYYYKDYDNNTGTYFACSDNGCSKNSSNTINRGVVKDLYIKQWWAKTWKSGDDNVCSVTLCYYIENKTSSSEYNYNYCNAITGGQQWGCNNQNTNVLSLVNDKPGNYNLNYYFKSSMGGSSCTTTVYSNTNAYYHTINFIVPGWSTASGTQSFSNTKLGSTTTVTDIDLGTHYGTTTTATAELTDGDTDDFSITSCDASKITVSFTPTALGDREATITITDAYSKTRTLTVSGKGISNTTPTVLIAKNESVTGTDVSLYGYLKYTGCETITEHGFVYAVSPTVPTTSNTKVQVGTSIAAGTEYDKTFEEGTSETYNYRAYIIAGGTTYYSAEVRQFTVNVACSIQHGVASSVTAQFSNGKTETSVAYASGSASIGLTVGDGCYADTYAWSCTSKPTDSEVEFTSASSRSTSVEVDTEGTYTFQLTATCSSGAISATSSAITLYVCTPANSQTVYLDNYTENVLCQGEKAVATCISQTGYNYTLYLGDQSFGTLEGTGESLTWHNVEGSGTFNVKSSPAALPQCAVTVGSATQTYNIPVINIDVDPAASVIAYKPVTLSKASTSTVDGNLTWSITLGSDGYLLDNTTKLEYDNRAKESVLFKGGLTNNAATTYNVSGTGSKTVEIGESGDDKTCEATTAVTIQVSPVPTESCNNK